MAADLWSRYGEGIERLTMVFPSRRARLFFGDALSAIIDRPMWQPADIQIDTLAEELSGLRRGERLRLVVELWRVYSEFHPTESFDDFYFWGELLIGDFDAVDKYLINSDLLFANLVDYHALDSRFDDLSLSERQMIERFWGSFRGGAFEGSGGGENFSSEQHDFLRIWQTLAPIYHRFRARLRELGIGYQGMIYREAAERIVAGETPQLPERQYVVVGFNALSRSEQAIFEHLKNSSRAEFYWDWDNYFLDDPAQESAMFLRDNLRRFPPAGSLNGGHDNFLKPKQIRSVSTASDPLQCKWAGRRLEELAKAKKLGKETAVVLCDEGLLEPLLWSLPPDTERVNVTMGYPLRFHPAYTFVERLVELQSRRKVSKNGSAAFYNSDVDGLSGHPYLAEKSSSEGPKKSKFVYVSAARLRTIPVFEHIFSTPEGWHELSDYLTEAIGLATENHPETEAVFEVITDHIGALKEALEACQIAVSMRTYATLLRRSLQSTTLPFEGEPLVGVQVMGILETRALDFENVIFLSSGDATMPGNLTGAPSFIPYNLKMAFGLPTPEHHEGVWAYHFFRLLTRARNVDLVWSKTTDERGAGEPSRYILQLDYESPHSVEHQDFTVDVSFSPTEPIVVEKQIEKIPHRLSPSLFWTWMECPLKFYFRAVARLRARDEVTGEVDGALFGNLLHGAMERLYRPLIGVAGVRKRIGELTHSPLVREAVEAAARELYVGRQDASVEDWEGSMLLAINTIAEYIDHHILPFDAALEDDFVIAELEGEREREIGGVTFYGRADRVDRLADGRHRVVDYKTGSPVGGAREAADFQVGLYAWMVGSGTIPALYYVRRMADSESLRGCLDFSTERIFVSGREIFATDEGGMVPPLATESVGEKRRPETKRPRVGNFKQPLSTKNIVFAPEAMEERLTEALAELFDPTKPFTQTDDKDRCRYCDFATICGR